MFAGYSRHLRFITLAIPLFLVIVGMSVPDLSRPHAPKPMRRAVLDKTPARSIQLSTVKIDTVLLITIAPAIVLVSSEEYSLEAEPLRFSAPVLPLDPLSPRAPPGINSFSLNSAFATRDLSPPERSSAACYGFPDAVTFPDGRKAPWPSFLANGDVAVNKYLYQTTKFPWKQPYEIDFDFVYNHCNCSYAHKLLCRV
ncbi:MAG: hypothetical protein CXR30_08645 [Geobacter sp.]|nr:MAG: hypothetical protein CXR30_08645 [Geobacter sp.]